MKFGFDLDGTLDRAALRGTALALAVAGHEIHIITGVFSEAGDWNHLEAKKDKVRRLFGHIPKDFFVHEIVSHPSEGDREIRLVNIGLQKGVLCEKLGIAVMFDDSDTYTKVMKSMAGDLVVCHVR